MRGIYHVLHFYERELRVIERTKLSIFYVLHSPQHCTGVNGRLRGTPHCKSIITLSKNENRSEHEINLPPPQLVVLFYTETRRFEMDKRTEFINNIVSQQDNLFLQYHVKM